MEEKSNVGSFIAKKRQKMGLTQKQLADKLFVTESAVSKWERGKSYPDITMVSNLCEILSVTESELMNASDDTRQTLIEKQAKTLVKMKKTYIFIMCLCMSIAVLTCFICNLAVNHTLSWFFIVLTAILLGFSLTVLPFLLRDKKGLITLLATYGTLVVMLITIRIVVGGGNWLLITLIAITLFMSLSFSLFLLQLLPWPLKKYPFTFYIAINTVLLILLLLVCALSSGGSWFFLAAVPTLFGIVTVFLPFVFREIGLKKKSHILVYGAIITALLYVMLLVVVPSKYFVSYALSIATACIIPVWICSALVILLPCNKLIKAGIILSFVILVEIAMVFVDIFFFPGSGGFNLSLFEWNLDTINANINFLVILALSLVTLLLYGLGIMKAIKNRKLKQAESEI